MAENEENAKAIAEAKKKNPWLYSTVAMTALLFIVAAFALSSPTGMVVANQLTVDEAGDKAIGYINDNLLSSGMTATLISAEDTGTVYKVVLEISGQTYDSYVTKDGAMLFTSGIDMTEVIETTTTTLPEVTKTEKPVANAFVMSYCPYGVQFLTAYAPVIELLGEKADINVNFVYYAMHGEKEITENTRMYCIQKDQKDKFAAYISCFVGSQDSASCMAQEGIDTSAVDSCMSATDTAFDITELYNNQSTWLSGRYPLYPVDAALNEQYDVGGSPTFVLNGKTISVSRTPEGIKQAICEAFINPPEECNQQLSADASASSGSCG